MTDPAISEASRTHRLTIPIDRGVFLYRRSQVSPWWHLSVHRAGKRVKYALHTRNRTHALAIARHRAEELIGATNQVILSRDPLLECLIPQYKRHIELRNVPSTRRLNLDNLDRVCRFIRSRLPSDRPIRLSDFTPDTIEDYMKARLAAGIAVPTVNRDRSTLYTLFRRAVRRRMIRVNPIEAVERLPEVKKRVPATLAEADLLRLLEEAAREVPLHGRGGKGKGNTRSRIMPLHDLVLFAANTGARLGEILYLEWSDIHLDQAEIRIVEKEDHPLKDRIERVIAANPLVLGMLRRRHEARKPQEPLVFPSAAGTVIDRRNVLRELKIVAKRVGLGQATFILLRHTALTGLARTGIPPFVLKQIAGHATLRTTERYYIGDVGGNLCIPPCIGMDLSSNPGGVNHGI